ncbi:ATPase H(+)-transporting accessory protein 2 [Oratosquilla oratoria]|uniref:ATPase H(+)-transporting accessory protein 2 n=1 Tax=Oratosquilla oratoria TaxID=337810 RepID=UPI003F774292
MSCQVIRYTALLSLLFIAGEALDGEANIPYFPRNLRFGPASPLKATYIDNLLGAALGYTVKQVPWNGMTITTPFDHPSAVVVLGIESGGAFIQQQGTTYSLIEDSTLDHVYQDLTNNVAARTERPTYFKYISVESSEDLTNLSGFHPKHLNASVEPDATFLKELSRLHQLVKDVIQVSSLSQGGQDIVFLEFKSLAPVVKEYGVDSTKVQEATNLLREQLALVTETAREVYSDNVLVLVVTMKGDKTLRYRRALLAEDEGNVDPNVSTGNSEDFPAIFNIILWTFLLLTIALIAISCSMAYMDPGRDSIIYRMTNPRMKKDQ